MQTVNVTLRIDPNLKKEADILFQDLGLNLSTAFNIFLRQSVREQKIPFTITKDVPNARTLAAMDDAENDNGIIGPFDNVDDLMRSLNA